MFTLIFEDFFTKYYMQIYYQPFKISGKYKAVEIIHIFMDPIYIIGPCPLTPY